MGAVAVAGLDTEWGVAVAGDAWVEAGVAECAVTRGTEKRGVNNDDQAGSTSAVETTADAQVAVGVDAKDTTVLG